MLCVPTTINYGLIVRNYGQKINLWILRFEWVTTNKVYPAFSCQINLAYGQFQEDIH